MILIYFKMLMRPTTCAQECMPPLVPFVAPLLKEVAILWQWQMLSRLGQI